ncbi:hypothetical protein [Agromyces sp. NPDC058064]|uniref:hypothetical protein n=1 Tax=Agromyces sp. NPDC058064 TaxID=3346322 RepID=UPI0036D7FA41
MSAPDLTPDEKGEVVRFGIHDEPRGLTPSMAIFDEIADPEDFEEKPTAMQCEAFMADHGMPRADFSALLREYRSESGWSAFQIGERDHLDSEFLNWFEWERLG